MPGHARTPGRHHSLGGPLPRQRANTTTARPTAPELWCGADAGPARRWGLPAVSRGYTRPWGWLPSPYSPFRHWPDPRTGPVRLACLIHAANVHSEPGSNPSKMVRRGFAGPKADSPRIGPHPERLRKEIQSQSARSRHDPKAVRPRTHCRPVLPIPPPWRPPDRGGQASRDDGPHAGSPQGSLTTRDGGSLFLPRVLALLSRLVSG